MQTEISYSMEKTFQTGSCLNILFLWSGISLFFCSNEPLRSWKVDVTVEFLQRLTIFCENREIKLKKLQKGQDLHTQRELYGGQSLPI